MGNTSHTDTMDDINSHQAIDFAADRLAPDLVDLSHRIHGHPEIGFQETLASGWLADALEAGGFMVERGVGGLATAFCATKLGSGLGPTIAVLSEYDALPDLGHACGHNIIATCGVGAGLAIATSGLDFPGRLLVVGTPAEEGGGGKIILARNGVFDDVDAAIMMHPAAKAMTRRGSLASGRVEATFHGRAAHAAGSPDQGINALESVIAMFNGVNARRLHFRADARVHGIVTHGGDAVNIIPARASCAWSVRAKDRTYQRTLVAIVREVAEAAAHMTGATLEWRETRGYDNMVPSPVVAQTCSGHLKALGFTDVAPAPDERMGSTDMGDISQLMPALHVYLPIAPEGTPGHSVLFREASVSAQADEIVVLGAKVLGRTASDLLRVPGLLDRAIAEHHEMVRAGTVAGRQGWTV